MGGGCVARRGEAMHSVARHRDVSPASPRRAAGGEDQFLIVELASDGGGVARRRVAVLGVAMRRSARQRGVGFPRSAHAPAAGVEVPF